MPRFLLLALFPLLFTACSPSLSPLYRDYETQETNVKVATSLETALRDAGWEVVATDTPNVVATEPRTVRHWGLYKIVVSLEAAPIGGEHVRLYFHPYRRYFTGGRGARCRICPSPRPSP